MPNQTWRDEATSADSRAAAPVLILIEHPALEDPIRITNAPGTWDETLETRVFTAIGEDWIYAGPLVEMPGQGEDEPNSSITVANADRRIGAALAKIRTAATVTLWVVLEAEPNTILSGPHRYLKLSNVRGNALTIRGRLTREDYTRERWPKQTVRISKYLAAGKA